MQGTCPPRPPHPPRGTSQSQPASPTVPYLPASLTVQQHRHAPVDEEGTRAVSYLRETRPTYLLSLLWAFLRLLALP